jgi:glycosyltransferase involved in cell wall biosynthesis
MARALEHLLDNPETHRRLSEAGRRRVLSEYTIQICAERWEAMLFRTQPRLIRDSECAY